MIKTITLLRHADSLDRQEYALKHSDDLKRPLSKKGKIQSKFIAKFLSKFLSFDLIICSNAKRTRQTIKPYIRKNAKQKIIYTDLIAPDCELQGYLDVFKLLDSDVKHILFVGHQPDLESFAKFICNDINFNVPKGLLISFSTKIDSTQNLNNAFKLDFALPPKFLDSKL